MGTYSRSQLASAWLHLRGEPLGFDRHLYLVGMIDSTAKDKLYVCSRQIGKSVELGVELLIDPICDDLPIKGLRELYVSGSRDQTKQFSVEKLYPLIYESPSYREMYTDKNSRKDVFLYTFTSGHQIYLRAVYRSPDTARGVPADKITIDEVQDIVPSFLPDILSSALASPYNRIIKAGTPRTEDNHIDHLWRSSKQMEWAVPCNMCKHWNCPLGEKNIGKKSVICEKCGRQINPLQGQWVITKSVGYTEAFHINQLSAYLNMTQEFWEHNILKNYEDWTDDKFNNEVLGLSSGKAQQLLTMEDMTACMQGTTNLVPLDKLYDSPPRKDCVWFAGVDWGEGRDEGTLIKGRKHYASYTIFYIATYDMFGKLVISHWKKFKGAEANPEFVIEYLIRKCKEWNVAKCGVDWGYGWGMIERLIIALGKDVVVSIYESHNLTGLIRYDANAHRYTINRNEMIARLVNAIKRKDIIFPKGSEEMFPDFIAERTEYSESLRQLLYIHRVNEPDDSLHALMYLRVVADVYRGTIVVAK